MFAAPSTERSHDGSSSCHRDKSKSGSTVKQKTNSPEVKLQPLFSEMYLSTPHGETGLLTSFRKNLPSNKAVLKLPHLVGQDGPDRAIAEARLVNVRRLMASAPGTDIAIGVTQLIAKSLAGDDGLIGASAGMGEREMKTKKATRLHKYPLTGADVIQMLAEKSNTEELFHLKGVDEDAYRPYDLQVTHARDAGSEHYIFSPNSVLHVTTTGFGGVVSLAEWHRECLLWTALQEIPFFRNFRVRKAFSCWHRTIHRIHFQRKCDNLQDLFLLAVPQFRTALHLLSGVIVELQEIHWMPLDDGKTLSLLEFNKVLITKNKECLLALQKLFKYQAALLNAAKDKSYENHKELQMQLKLAKKMNRSSEPIHLLLARQQGLKKQLAESERILQRLGNFVALVHRMIVQSLVTVVLQDATAFLTMYKRVSSQQCSVFRTELCFGANSQLTINPGVCEFHKTLTKSLLRSDGTIVQMCESLGFFLEISNKVFRSNLDFTFECSTAAGANTDRINDQASRVRLLHSELTVQGQMVNGCYYPLSKAQLEWHIEINDCTNQLERELAKIVQETELEIKRVCERYTWLKDIHLFVSLWSLASLETMKGRPASVYEEHIKMLQRWAQRIQTVSPSTCTSGNLIVIDSTKTKETLLQQLGLINEQVQDLLVDQVKRQSESLIIDLDRMTAKLRMEPEDVHDFSEYALTVREFMKMLPDMQSRLEYILSLRDTICMSCRKMTEEEMTLEKKMLVLWDDFIALLKQKENLVSRTLPTVSNALGTMFSYLTCDLRSIVFKASSGPFVDPNQNAWEMVSKLKYMSARVKTLHTKLDELHSCSQSMQEQQLDLTVPAADVKKIVAREQLWKLKAECTAWMEQWIQLPLTEFSVSQALEQIAIWKNQTLPVTNIIPAADAVLKETSGVLQCLSQQVEVLAKLRSTALKEKHWKRIFKGLGLLDVEEHKVTVGQFMSEFVPETHQELLDKACREAQKELDLEKEFQAICLGWKDRLFQIHTLVLPVCSHCEQNEFKNEEILTQSSLSSVHASCQYSCTDARFIIVDLETHFVEIQKDLITLSTFLKCSQDVEFRQQLEDLVQSLKDLADLLDLFERYQQMWAFLTKVFREISNHDQRRDQLTQFQLVDDAFKTIMHSISKDPHMWNFVCSEFYPKHDGESLCKILLNGLFTMEGVSNQMETVFQNFRQQFPRLYFLSEREIMQLLSFHPSKKPLFLRKCFKGVRLLEVDLQISSNTNNSGSTRPLSKNPEQMKVLGVFGSLQEHIAFQPALGPNPDILAWLCAFEKHLKWSMAKLLKKCTVLRKQLEPVSQDFTDNSKVGGPHPHSCDTDKLEDAHPLLDLLFEFPLQCLLVVEEDFWCRGVLKACQEGSPLKLNNLKTHNSSKLKILSNVVRNRVLGSENKSLISNYAMTCLRALIQLTMNHGEQLSRLTGLPGVLQSSFEWLSMMKYHINIEDDILDCSDETSCYVDILNHHFQYGLEYYGPDDWLMVHTPTTDKAALGIFLALIKYRSGFVGGLPMSGRTNTVIQLGKALGQLVVVKQCFPSMGSAVVQRMLLGAMEAGVWLLLESVDLLSQSVLSVLGQLLTDTHHHYLNLQRDNIQKLNKKASVTGCINILDPECHFQLLGKEISPKPSFACFLTSSNENASKIPNGLRFAARPVSLAHPDYRIVAEVTLASIGFLEAMSLSHRLVCLITLVKDSECLPDLFNHSQSCFLVVLQKIISISEIYLRHAVCQQEITIQGKVIAAEQSESLSVGRLPDKQFVKDGEATAKLPKLHISQLSAIQAVMEETVVVKAILSVLTPENKKASQFYSILNNIFPMASQFPDFQKGFQEREKKLFLDATVEELEAVHLYSDMELINQSLNLYQTMKFSHAVILLGPPASRKTTCYRILAGALNRLARTNITNTSHTDQQISTLNSSYVDTVVLFPNAMSHSELFGCLCEKRGWRDGAVTKVLKAAERYERPCFELHVNEIDREETSLVKWLVMDGEPVGHPCWLDYLTTLCSSQDPHLCLSSGETLLSPSPLNLLLEVTDLRDASPSAVTRCGLVYFEQTDLWKGIWRSEIEAVSIEYKLDEGVQKTWNRLAHDLFNSTLTLLGQHGLSSANHFERVSHGKYGIQEITSFVRILRALLQNFAKQLKNPNTILRKDREDVTLGGISNPSTNAQSEKELLAINLFLVAYVWGFGGHLQFRHWPQFDLLARKVLFASRYKIEFSHRDSLFEHFIDNDCKMHPSETHSTDFITPKFRTYRHLLNLMLEANQPVLIAGEPGSGRTTLSNCLLSSDQPHINIAASPLLSSRDLCLILKNICRQRKSKDTFSVAKQPGLLLFVDDLHEAPSDVFGKASTALEALRQSISKGEILTFDSHCFESLSSKAVSYLATTIISRLGDVGSDGISLRLSRLFSIFVLPSLSEEAIFSFHSTLLKTWLREMPLTRGADEMSNCIITATKSLYVAVCDLFQPTGQRPFFIFSHHDIEKVFSGMYLWQQGLFCTENQNGSNLPSGSLPSPSLASVAALNITHLWMHECMRTFADRLCSQDEMNTFFSLVGKTAATHYASHFIDGIQMDTLEVEDAQQLLVEAERSSDAVGQMVGAANLRQGIGLAGHSDFQEVHEVSKVLSKEKGHLKSYTVGPEMFKNMVEDMTRLVYVPELFKAAKPAKQQQNLKDRCPYQRQDFDVLQQKLRAFIDNEVDDAYNIASRYILHRQGLSQLLHILRALLVPGGHGVLIGSEKGTGRKTAVRLAACITGFQLMELDSSNEEEFYTILKEAETKTNVDGVNVIILVHESISPHLREELLMVMARKASPVDYREENLSSHIFRVTSLKQSRRYIMENWINEKSFCEDYKNVHMFLLMPFTTTGNGTIPAKKETQSWSAQMAKALKLSCCVEVYQPFSSQSLAEVALQCLRQFPFEITKECPEDGFSVAMARIHLSACQHASVFLNSQPFSPATYLEFIDSFGYLCNKLNNQWQSKHNRIATALTQLDVVKNTSKLCKEHLIHLQERMDNAQQLEEELLGVVEEKKILLEAVLEKSAVGESKLSHFEEQIIQSENLIKPVFQSGLMILNCLNPTDLEEVRHYRDPPDGVVKIMDAICLMFNRPAGWESAKQLLGQPDFFQELEFFDRSGLTDEQLQQLGQIVQSPQFVPESVREVSKACESLCRWVQAMYETCSMQQHLLVKQQLEVQAGEARRQLNLLKQQAKEANQCLEETELQLQNVRDEQEALRRQLYKAEDQEEEATACAVQVEMHHENWTAAFQETEFGHQNLPGDALILAAILSYLGPFGADLRTELLSKWRELCQTGSIDVNPKDLRMSLFTDAGTEFISPTPGFPIAVTERLQLPLGCILEMEEWQLEDTLSTRLIVKLLLWGHKEALVQRRLLLADADQHIERSAQKWFTSGENAKLETELDFGLVVRADDQQLMERLGVAADKGWKVLVTHVERAKPNPEFLATLVLSSGSRFHRPQQPPRTVHPDFQLFLSTPLPVSLLSSGVDPSVLTRALVVDLSLSSEEIRELMLTQLLQPDCGVLLIQQARSQNHNQLVRAKLASAEEALLDYVLQSERSLLTDSDFLPRVAACREETKKLQAERERLSGELESHESLLAAPRQLMKLTAALYQAVRAVSRLSPAYYLSLQDFMKATRDAFSEKGRTLVLCATGKAAQSALLEITNTMVHQLLIQYRPRLFKRHFSVFKLLVSLAVLEHNQLCSEAEKMLFLRGLKDIEHHVPDARAPVCAPETALHSSGDLPGWIPSSVHSELLLLEKIPCFNKLIESLSASPTEWQEYLFLTSSTIVGNVPCCSHSHLSLLQRTILWKTIRPECLEQVVDAMSACLLCPPVKPVAAPHSGNPDVLSRYLARNERPIILTVPNFDGDLQISIQPLHFIQQLAQRDRRNKVQVKVICLGGPFDKELILSMLDEASREGQWLVFNDCHLLENWDEELVGRLSQLTPSSKVDGGGIHPCFRLWFVNQEDSAESLPAVVRMPALPLCCDSPWDLTEEISYSYQQVLSLTQHCSDAADGNMEVLLRCAVFHSVLVQRQTYKYLSSGRMYHWSQEDLLNLLEGYILFASRCRDKSDVLCCIAAGVAHGGHIADSINLEVVESVAKCCFATESSLSGGGPCVLSDMISSCSHHGVSGLLRVLEKRFRELEVSEPVVLGFGADVAPEVATINSADLNVLLQDSQTPSGAARSVCPRQDLPVKMPVEMKARERLQALKNYLTHKIDGAIKNEPAADRSPLRDFLQAEWEDLTASVSRLLSHLQTPAQHNSSPAPPVNFPDLCRLEKRAELLGAYLGYGCGPDPPGAYRLAAFKRPRGFLLALTREAALEHYKYVSDVILQFQVLCENTASAGLPPDAVFLRGLQLTGASWDPETGALQAGGPTGPFSMLALCVTARVRPENSGTHARPRKSSYLTDEDNLQAAPSAERLPVYHCPLYVNEECESGTRGLSDANVITRIPLRAKPNPALCSLRRVRLVSTL